MKTTFFSFLLLAPFIMFAQQHQHHCASFDVIANWESQYPGTEQALNDVIKNAQQLQKNQDKRNGSRANDIIYRIPVVVHVLYTQPSENIHDSLIYNQIEVLNNAFRRDNGDTIYTRAEFKPFAGDAGIEFYLADLDPDGNPTTGITRKSTTQPSGFGFSAFNDAMKKSSTGGADAWPTDNYLNIWVCDINSSPILGLVLGYAFPPIGNLPNWPANSAPADSTLQGVVIYTNVFGRNNPLATNDPDLRTVALGKTTVHEVGHYLGLRHIWGEDASNPFGTGSCLLDDFVGDTPPTINRSEQACDLTKNECGPVCPNALDLHDMIENYMDYSVDSCNNMFTVGQIQIMRGVLANFRTRLAESTIGVIKPIASGNASNTYVIGNADSLVVTIDYTRYQHGSVYPNTFATGDSLNGNATGQFLATGCQQVVLYPGDYLVNAAGDTLYFTIGDTVNTYDDGTVQIKPYIASVGVSALTNSSFKVYPNPTKGLVSISMSRNIAINSLSLANLIGETVMTRTTGLTGNITLDLSHLASGVYLLQVQTAEGLSVQRLVIE